MTDSYPLSVQMNKTKKLQTYSMYEKHRSYWDAICDYEKQIIRITNQINTLNPNDQITFQKLISLIETRANCYLQICKYKTAYLELENEINKVENPPKYDEVEHNVHPEIAEYAQQINAEYAQKINDELASTYDPKPMEYIMDQVKSGRTQEDIQLLTMLVANQLY